MVSVFVDVWRVRGVRLASDHELLFGAEDHSRGAVGEHEEEAEGEGDP